MLACLFKNIPLYANTTVEPTNTQSINLVVVFDVLLRQ